MSRPDPSCGHPIYVDVRFGRWDRAEARSASSQLRAGLLSAVPLRETIRTAFGKPVLRGNLGPHWSSSSTVGAAGIAWSDQQPVGLDLEGDDRDLPTATLLEDTLTHDELRRWEQRPSSELFTEIWARKEASLKCIGTGLSLPPNRVRVGLPAAQWHRVTLEDEQRTVCWVRSIQIAQRVACAIACQSPGLLLMTRLGEAGQADPRGVRFASAAARSDSLSAPSRARAKPT